MPICGIRSPPISGSGTRGAISGLATLGLMFPAAILRSTELSEYSDTTPQIYGGLE